MQNELNPKFYAKSDTCDERLTGCILLAILFARHVYRSPAKKIKQLSLRMFKIKFLTEQGC